VVAIILIIAAIAIPNLLRLPRMAANESFLQSVSLRTIDTAEMTFTTDVSRMSVYANLSSLGGAGHGLRNGHGRNFHDRLPD